jgi:membrane protein DedA with SNARE-associated domain
LSVFSAVAGVMRIEWRKFTLYTFLGALVRVFSLGLIGWFVGGAYTIVAGHIELLEKIGTIILIGLVIGGLFYLYRKKRTR